MSLFRRVVLAMCLLAGMGSVQAALYLQTFSVDGPSDFGPGSTFRLNAEVTYDSVAGTYVWDPTYLVDGTPLVGGSHIVEDLSGNARSRSTFRQYPSFGTFEIFIRFLQPFTADSTLTATMIYSDAATSSSESFRFSTPVRVTQLQIPEPGTLALAGLALAGLALGRRRLTR